MEGCCFQQQGATHEYYGMQDDLPLHPVQIPTAVYRDLSDFGGGNGSYFALIESET
jgi:hypothetical protein